MFEKICLILLVNLLFFAKTMTYKYSSDDIPVFQNPPKFNNTWEKVLCWLDGRYRSGPQVDHVLTTLIHATVCVFIYLGFGKNDISFIASLLFAFNPTNNQGSVWISGRAYALAALGMTGALSLPFIGGIFILLATYTNPGFLAPLVLFGSNHAIILLFLPLAYFINGGRFKRNVKYKMEKEMFKEDKAIKPEKIILVIKTFGFYTVLSLIPFQNTFYHSFLESASGCGRFKAYSMKDRFFWIGLLSAIGIVCYLFMAPWSMISFGLLWWGICLAPFLNFMRMSQETAERYCYLPSVGLMFVLASVIHAYPLVIAIFLTMYATRLWFLMDMYTDDYYLLEHCCLLDPSSWFVWHVRGMKRWENKSYQEAVIIWTMARMISPLEFKINFNLATALSMSGHIKEAQVFIEIAEKNVPPGQEEESGKLLSEWKQGRLAIIL